MYKYLILLFLLILSACNNSDKKDNTIHVSILRGPSSILFAEWLENPPIIDNKKIKISIYDSPELLHSSLIKEESGIAILPLINAANLYTKGIPYNLLGCPVWGTLYLVEKRGISEEENEIYIFGSGTTPDILTRFYIDQTENKYLLKYNFSTAGEIFQAISAGKINRAVLSEPFVSMLLEKDSIFHITADLNYIENLESDFPQTGIIIHPTLIKHYKSINKLLLEASIYVKENPDNVIKILEKQNIFPTYSLNTESIKRCKISYVPANECDNYIWNFLDLILRVEPKAIGGKLPEKSFILESI